ncbi:MAG: TonB-dependent receptor [Gammaproteobacteria bacterium]
MPPCPRDGRRSRRAVGLLSCGLIVVAPYAAAADDSAASARTMEEVVVYGSGSQVELPPLFAGEQVARGGRVGLFGNLDFMETPFTSTNYSAELMRNQQSVSVADVLRNDPTVQVARGFGNFQEVYVIRGMPVFSDDMTYNGLYGILPRQFVAAEFLERVEVFRGASAFLNGAAPGGSGLGGAVNLVPKRARAAPLTRFTTGFQNDGHAYAALDAGRRFGAGDAFGVRVNAMRRDGETAVDGEDRELTVFSTGFDFAGERLRLSADFGFQDHDVDRPRPSVTPAGAVPGAPDSDDNFAQPWTYTEETQLFGVARGEYDLTDHVTLWLAGGARGGEEDNVLANPTATVNGTTTAFRFDNYREDTVYSGEAGARAEFATGPIAHRLVVSGSIYSLESNNAFALSSFFAPFASSIYDPVAVVAPVADFFTGGVLNDPRVTQGTDMRSIAVADMIALFDERVLLTGGARLQNIEQRSYDFNTGARLSGYDESRWTPVGGIVVRPLTQVALYANYIEGLQPGDVAPALSGAVPVANAGEVFAPYQSEQYEVGVKYDGGNLGVTVAWFSTSVPGGFVENGVFSVDGRQRNRGFEMSLFGAPREDVRILGGFTVLDAEQRRTPGKLFDGNDVVGVPDVQGNVNLEWDLPILAGLTADARFIYTASQYVDAANTFATPAWTRFDLGVRYATTVAGRGVSLRARLENVAGNDYWASVGGFPGANYLVLGAPRTFLMSAAVDF